MSITEIERPQRSSGARRRFSTGVKAVAVGLGLALATAACGGPSSTNALRARDLGGRR